MITPLRFRRPAAILLCCVASAWAAVAAAQVLPPPPVTINQTSGLLAPGYVFITPAGPASGTYRNGPEILDNQGRPVWFQPLPVNGLAADFRVQTYQGQPVLTWTQGTGFENMTPGSNTDYICDTHYKVIAALQAGNGLNADQHEFQLTPQNTALISIYRSVNMDLTSIGGQANGIVFEGVAQEIDVATGNVLWEWHSLDHVPLSESYVSAPTSGAFDYFHINAVSLDTDGNILISARHTWTVYKVDRKTGEVIWRLGGKKSDFALGAGLPFAWQHNPVAVDATTIRIFDNESNGAPAMPASRVIWVKHDDVAKTATIIQTITHPQGLSALAEGSSQALANGDTFVGWGILGRFSEFDANGGLLFDAGLPAGYGSYRAYRFPWAGTPPGVPSASGDFNADGTTTVHAVWNGATQVANWQVMAGAAPDSLTSIVTAPWNGLDTAISVAAQSPYVEVVALDASGAVLGTSSAVAVAPAFSLQPASQTIATGSTAVFTVTAGGALSYQWFRNGAPLADGGEFAGTATPTLVISGATPADDGTFTCVASDLLSSTTSQAATLAAVATADPGRLINVSCRANVGTGDNVLIEGFAVGGGSPAGSDPVLLRASGPALEAFGLTGVLPDPALQLVGATPLAQSDAAAQISSTSAAVGAFAWTDAAGLDQAQLATLQPGPYTAVVSGRQGDTGIALAEVYDASPGAAYSPSTPHLINVSARAPVGTNGNALIAGFVIGGSTAKTVLIRAAGPALIPFGLPDALPDPVVLLQGSTAGAAPLATNGSWGGNDAIAAAAARVGAFPWGDPTSHDAALLVTLAPGTYTAEVLGQTADSGVALVEVYEVP